MKTWPPKTDKARKEALKRQIAMDPYLSYISTFRHAEPYVFEPVTDEEKAKLKAEKAKALEFIESFRR